mgnify:FL=1
MSIPLIFHIDVSGQPKEEIIVGMASIRSDYLTEFIRHMKKDRPEFLRHKFKGSNLKSNQIKSYISYLNGKGIRMVSVRFKSAYWSEFKKYLDNKKYWKERVYASLYFLAVKKYARSGYAYPLVVCKESYLDIERVKNYLIKIAKAHGVSFQISDSYASQNDMIKVADMVAAAGRKLRGQLTHLDGYEESFPNPEQLKFYIEKIK